MISEGNISARLALQTPPRRDTAQKQPFQERAQCRKAERPPPRKEEKEPHGRESTLKTHTPGTDVARKGQKAEEESRKNVSARNPRGGNRGNCFSASGLLYNKEANFQRLFLL